MNYQQQLANSAAIRSEIQRFESVHPNIYSIYELLERLDEPALQNQIREHVIAIEGKRQLHGALSAMLTVLFQGNLHCSGSDMQMHLMSFDIVCRMWHLSLRMSLSSVNSVIAGCALSTFLCCAAVNDLLTLAVDPISLEILLTPRVPWYLGKYVTTCTPFHTFLKALGAK